MFTDATVLTLYAAARRADDLRVRRATATPQPRRALRLPRIASPFSLVNTHNCRAAGLS